MSPRTVLSTDWIEVRGGRAYAARVFLTDLDEAYMLTVQDGKKRFFRVDPKLLKLGELGFFEKVMENASKISEKRHPIRDLRIRNQVLLW